MYRTVLVPLDGSPLAERALPFARALAGEAGGRLVLVRCASAAPAALRDLAVAHAAAVAEAESYLRQVTVGAGAPRPWRPAPPVGTGRTEIAVPLGPAAEGILAEAARHRADAIAMTTHGRSGSGRCLYGRVADAVLRKAEVPVLLVPATARSRVAWAGDQTLRVLVPLDGSAAAEAILEPVADLAGTTRLRILLLRVVEPDLSHRALLDPGMESAADRTAETEAARRYLEGVADGLRPTGAAVAVYATVGYPEAEIALQGQKGYVDLVAMTTGGCTGATPDGLGSVAAAAVQFAGVPALLVRAGARLAAPAWTSGALAGSAR